MNNIPEKIKTVCLYAEATVRDALIVLEDTHRRIALVVDEEGKLEGTITDGDVRRGLLAGIEPSTATARKVMNNHPVVGQIGMQRKEMLRKMSSRGIQQLPLLNERHQVVDLMLLSELVKEKRLDAKAVIMAGGTGRRLRPLTADKPKPLLPVAGKPILQIIVEQLLDAGIDTVFILTHYKAEMIAEHFGEYTQNSSEVQLIREEAPLGTAGGLRIIADQLDTPFILMNADVLTRLDFAELLAVHLRRQAAMTVGVKQQDLQIPYGVFESDDEGIVTNFAEKPVYSLRYNIGIYSLSPASLQYLPDSGPSDITDLIEKLLRSRERIVEYPVNDYWMDIGRMSDYEKACEDVLTNKF